MTVSAAYLGILEADGQFWLNQVLNVTVDSVDRVILVRWVL